MDPCCEFLGPCWEFLRGIFGEKDHALQREEFERTVAFLASVPLFRQQLPRAQLPKVAQHLTRKVWLPGQRLVKQGETGRAFFLIQAGEALVVTGEDDSPENVRTRLCAGDYFGGHTLITERPNVATIVAGNGEEHLSTLSMSRKEFEKVGLARWLSFPKRPALYGENGESAASAADQSSVSLNSQGEELAPEEVTFAREAILRNANLRALLQVSEDKLQELAVSAARVEVPAGQVIGTAGDIGHEFYIVREGSVSASVESSLKPAGHSQQSAESAVAHSTMAERFLRKQHFLQELAAQAVNDRKNSESTPRVTASLFLPGNLEKTKADLTARRGSRRPTQPNSFANNEARGMGRQVSEADPPQAAQRRKVKLLERFKSRSNIDNGAQVTEEEIVPADISPKETVLESGESFGELSILYNMHMHATFKAKTACVLYAIRRRHFTATFNRKGRRFGDTLKLLEEVHLLTPLLNSERYELACNATGFVHFQPGERVLHQGRVRETRRWYIVFSGSAIVSHDEEVDGKMESQQLATLTRGGHFGERSLLRGDAAAPVNVDSGPEGMCCLTFHGEGTRVLLTKVMEQETVPSVHSDLKEWWVRKAKGFTLTDEAPPEGAWDPLASDCTVQLPDLKKVCVLGKGGYGQVCLVKDDANDRKYALKTLSKGHIQSQGAERLVIWEREIMSMIDSVFVIRLHKTFKDSQFVYFLLECALGGSLVGVLRNHSEVFTEDAPRGKSLAFYVGCLTAALEHLHERRIVHRDLKPENVLLDEAGYGKLCDMGFARFVLTKTNTLMGTPEYMAPELIDFPHTHCHMVDWWALGVLSYEVLVGQTPFQDDCDTDPVGRLLAIRRSQEIGILSYPFHFPFMAKAFVSKLLLKNPNERLGSSGAKEIREQPFFKSVHFDFDALHAQTLPAPFRQAWVEPESTPSDSPEEPSSHGLDAKDSIFIQCNSNKNWDAMF